MSALTAQQEFALKVIRQIVSAALVLGISGCTWYMRTAPPVELEGLPAASPSSDDVFTRLSLRVPRFAGLYADGEGVLHAKVATLDAQQLPSAEAVHGALVSVGMVPALTPAPRIVVQASNTRHTWPELQLYKTQLRDVLAIEGVSFLDADEVAGLVVVGVAHDAARARVVDFVRATQVPSDAWTTESMPMQERMADLQDFFRPLVGGVQIKNDSGPFAFLGFAGICTLGIVGDRGGVTGFITNSHCTRVQGGTEGTNFRQSGRDILWGDYVAHESVDPPWTASVPGCAFGSVCRFSDAAFAVVDIGNQNAAYASVARPAQLCVGNAPCSIAMTNPLDRIEITGTVGPLLSGSLVTKVGRTSGWTGGAVLRTCVDVPQAGTNLLVLCQTTFGVGSLPGDSGSPVIVPSSAPVIPLPTKGVLAGILWGGSATNSVFSPIGAVVSELGGVRLFPNAGGGTPTRPVTACVLDCRADRDSCMAAVPERGGPRPGQCVTELRSCLRQCP